MLPSDVKLIFSRVLCRDASDAEASAWAAIAGTTSDTCVQNAIAQSLEAITFVDSLIRLYQGAFSRVPDTTNPPQGSGFYFWVSYNHTAGISNIASNFVSSSEFLSIYSSNQVSAALITAFYFNVLRREPSVDEVNSWLHTGLNAAQILVGFTESAEFKVSSLPRVNAFKAALIAGHNPTGTLFNFT
jgi:hypothetical protein